MRQVKTFTFPCETDIGTCSTTAAAEQNIWNYLEVTHHYKFHKNNPQRVGWMDGCYTLLTQPTHTKQYIKGHNFLMQSNEIYKAMAI